MGAAAPQTATAAVARRAIGDITEAATQPVPVRGRLRGRTYVGTRLDGTCRIGIAWAGSTTTAMAGFHLGLPNVEWGALTPACRNLAWALLFDATDDPQMADDWSGDFAEEVVSRLPLVGFALAEADLLDWLHLSLPPPALSVPACP